MTPARRNTPVRVKPRRIGLSTTTAGYGREHQIRRRSIAPFVDGGLADCARCGRPIIKGQAWDLGHVDGDKNRYAGPEHRHSVDCPEGGNRATAGRRPQKRVSREW